MATATLVLYRLDSVPASFGSDHLWMVAMFARWAGQHLVTRKQEYLRWLLRRCGQQTSCYGAHCICHQTTVAFGSDIFYLLAFFYPTESDLRDGRMVYENVIGSIVGSNKPVAFFNVEPLHGAGTFISHLPLAVSSRCVVTCRKELV